MALTKIGKEGITGVSNASNATFLTATSAEGVTLAGTLAVTGVHTVGTNAVATSEGGAVTTNIVQGLAKCWLRMNGEGTIAINDSFNITSITDQAVGNFRVAIANDMGSANYSATAGGGGGADNNTLTVVSTPEPNFAAGTLDLDCVYVHTTAFDPPIVSLTIHGDLA